MVWRAKLAGREELSAFLSQCRVLINLLPNTPETVGIINQQLIEKLPDGAYLLNLARGVHVVEDDLLAALDSGKVKVQCWMFLIANPYRRKVRSGYILAWR